MKRFDLRGSGEERITGILTKPAFDEVIVSEKVRERSFLRSVLTGRS